MIQPPKQIDREEQLQACAEQLESCRMRIRRMFSDVTFGEDLYQEVCVRCFRCLANRNWLEPHYGFIYEVARRVMIDFCRRATVREKVSMKSDEVENALSLDVQPVDCVLKREALRLILDRLTHLPRVQRDALKAHYLRNKTTKEIAESCKLPVNTIKTRIRRGTEALRKDASLRRYFINEHESQTRWSIQRKQFPEERRVNVETIKFRGRILCS